MNKRKILFAVMLILAFNGFAQTKEIANGTVIEKDSRKIVRKHEQQLVIDYSASDFQLVIYDNPIKKNQIGNLQRKQEITIKQIIFLDEKETWFKIEYDNKEGYILYSSFINDPYKNDVWLPVEEIKSGSKTYHTKKYASTYFVYTNLRIRDKPGLEGTKIGLIEATHSKYATVKTKEVTEEKETIDGITERWAKIEYNGITGWVFGGYLEIERGGPKFITPEWDIEMSLGAGI